MNTSSKLFVTLHRNELYATHSDECAAVDHVIDETHFAATRNLTSKEAALTNRRTENQTQKWRRAVHYPQETEKQIHTRMQNGGRALCYVPHQYGLAQYIQREKEIHIHMVGGFSTATSYITPIHKHHQLKAEGVWRDCQHCSSHWLICTE